MDALKLLKQDHETIKDLFDKIELDQDTISRKGTFEQIRQELLHHSDLEETVFYPACERHTEMTDLILQSYEDHQELRLNLDELHRERNQDHFDELIMEMIEDVRDHIATEELDVFRLVRTVMSEAEFNQLSQAMTEYKYKTSGNDLEAA